MTFETRAQLGDLVSFYLQPELLANAEYGAARLATGYAKLTLFNVELAVGRESLWWGPSLHGSLILSNNGPPLDQIRLGRAVSPAMDREVVHGRLQRRGRRGTPSEENVVDGKGEVGECLDRQALAVRRALHVSIPLLRRPAVDLDGAACEVHEPGFVDSGPRVEGNLDRAVELQRGVGDLYEQQDIVRSWMRIDSKFRLPKAGS